MGSWVQCGDSVRRSFKRFLDKTLANFSSLKFYVVVTASYLKLTGDLDSEYWFYAIILCVGSRDTLKLGFEALSALRDVKLGAGRTTNVVNVTAKPQDKEVPREIAD